MTLSVEEFGKQLIKQISANPGGHAYVLTTNLISAIQLVLNPAGEPSQEFPRMLFRPSPAGELVNDDQELHNALEQGWRRERVPRPVGYPINMVEVNPARGTDYRRVLVRNPQEEKLFLANTNPADWVKDNVYALAGRSVLLDDLVEEHRLELHQALDAELRNPAPAEEENAASDAADASTESAK